MAKNTKNDSCKYTITGRHVCEAMNEQLTTNKQLTVAPITIMRTQGYL